MFENRIESYRFILLLSVQFVIDYLKKQVEKKSDRIIDVPDDLIILNLGLFD